jgi:hypothetical protein
VPDNDRDPADPADPDGDPAADGSSRRRRKSIRRREDVGPSWGELAEGVPTGSTSRRATKANCARNRPPGSSRRQPSSSSTWASRAATELWCRCSIAAALRSDPVRQNASSAATSSAPAGVAASASRAATSG